MKKKFIRIIGLVLLLILAIQTFCFADVIAPNEPRKTFEFMFRPSASNRSSCR